MAQLLVRQIDDDVKRRLQERAARRGVSMEEEAREIIRAAVLTDPGTETGLGSRIAALFRDVPDNNEPLPKLPRQPFKPVDFSE
ncbi:plasmid stabilization protein [Mesorhizobium sp. KR2-14]|uniref:FitA-like ribbon-helix-helix domain-containing protein n=1 Tax=Mesorhizobium sp. KR2-14 TaxID=3156610 RepID=UPI0032B3B911